jgi:hypothetical protein
MEYSISSGFPSRRRTLIITDDYVEWENGNIKGNEFTRLNKADIVDFKHGMDWIIWYRFAVGHSFSITFLDKTEKELQIRFNSHFGFNKDNLQKYSDIVDDIWKLFHTDVVNGFVNRVCSHEEVTIRGVKLKIEGIELLQSRTFIPWNKVATKDYETYFAIYHQDNSSIHARIGYNEYGTETLWGAIRKMLSVPL